MAHMIDDTAGAPAIAYAGATPWHKLGRKMGETERRDIAAAMKLAGLDWLVEAVDLAYQTATLPGTVTPGAQVMRKVPDARGIVRVDTGAYLGTVGSQYTPIQNAEALAVVQPLVERHGCTIEVMASLDGGRRTFALLRMADSTITPAPGDDVRGYLLVLTSHDGSGSAKVILTPIRVVCQNTLTLATKGLNSGVVTVRHTKSAPDRLAEAASIIDRMQDALQKTGETYAALAQRSMTSAELRAYIETVIPVSKADQVAGTIPDVINERRREIARLIFDGHHVEDGITSAATATATAWRAYNAVTEYFDHIRAREAKSASARATAYDSALFGGNAAIKAQALRVLVAA